MRHWLLFAFLVIATSAPKLWAAESAPGPLKTCVGGKVRDAVSLKPIISELPEIHELPLPADLVAAIHRHPIAKWAQKHQGPFPVYAGLHLHRTSGEGVQTKFLLKVLREIFPDLNLMNDAELGEREFNHLRYFKIDISDTAETNPSKDPQRFHVDVADRTTGRRRGVLDMPILKPANGTASSIDRNRVKRVLGIGAQSRTVSLYTNRIEVVGPLSMISETIQPKVIFYSLSIDWPLSDTYDVLSRWADKHGFAIFYLSKIRRGDLETPHQKYLVVNDTRGRMPMLHAASDLSVIDGPINMFESLTVGTPTVIYLHKEVLNIEGFYHPETFKNMLSVALQTGAARHLDHPESASRVLAEAIQLNRKFTRPYLIRGPDGKTPVDRMLDHLQQVMEEQGL